MTCESEIPRALWTPCSTNDGVEWASLRPHAGMMGSAWRQRSATTMNARRRRTPMSPYAPFPDPARLIGRLLQRLYRRRASQTVDVGSPSPAPGTHGRIGDMQLPLCTRDRVPTSLELRKAAKKNTSAPRGRLSLDNREPHKGWT
jgi:hypothetical protein